MTLIFPSFLNVMMMFVVLWPFQSVFYIAFFTCQRFSPLHCSYFSLFTLTSFLLYPFLTFLFSSSFLIYCHWTFYSSFSFNGMNNDIHWRTLTPYRMVYYATILNNSFKWWHQGGNLTSVEGQKHLRFCLEKLLVKRKTFSTILFFSQEKTEKEEFFFRETLQER